MKVLMINKFLYPNGGSETYIFQLGKALELHGHEVQYFGMEHEGRCVGNRANAYTSDMDFHGGSKFAKVTYPLKTIYSIEARKKIRIVLDDFKPDVCHLNNFNYQLTPSIILEIRKWSKQTGHTCRIVYTAHDYQLVCPNHLMNNPVSHLNCEKCLEGHYFHCIKDKCIHGSVSKSVVGCVEATFWKMKETYRMIDVIICCSEFIKSKLDTNRVLQGRTVVLHNFIHTGNCDINDNDSISLNNMGIQKEYCLFFGRYSDEKGIGILIEACKQLPHIDFVFAGNGPLEDEVSKVENIQNVGYKQEEDIAVLIRNAKFSICPSICYDNCPFSVMESQMYGTPVIGADIGGIPELIENNATGILFKSGSVTELTNAISELWNDKDKRKRMSENCMQVKFDTVEQYYKKLMKIYNGEI